VTAHEESKARGEAPSKLEFRPVLRRIVDGYRYDWKLLLFAGLLVFVPIGLITSLDPFDGYALDDWDGGRSVVPLILLVAQSVVPLIGAVFYSGVVAAGELERQSGERHGLSHVARTLPYWTLIVADIGLILVVAVGFVALFIPGLIFLTWFALIAPIIEMERLGTRAAFRRSREMVRPYFWKVAGLMIPLSILQSALEGVGDEIGHSLLGHTFLGNWVGSTAANLLGSPLYALTALALYFEISRREKPTAG
jgi:hypothetical protein